MQMLKKLILKKIFKKINKNRKLMYKLYFEQLLYIIFIRK